jgi:hypothetical protein
MKESTKETIKVALGITVFLIVLGLIGHQDFINMYGGV